MNDGSVFILIPAYNESGVITNVLFDLHAHGYKNIIIVDDGSTDDLLTPLRNFSVHYLRHDTNLGQGAALQTAFEYACTVHAGIAVTFDADGQHRAEDISQLIEPIIENKADIVLGSRFKIPNAEKIPFYKQLLLKSATLLNLLLSGISLSDAHNGMRALNSKALETITLKENRMAHASEILFEIKKHRLRYVEAPVTIRYTTYSKQKGQSLFDSIKILFDLVLHKLFK